MNKYQQRMDELKAVFVNASDSVKNTPATDANIIAVEKEIGISLPPDYREFLRDYGMFFFPHGVLVPIQNGGEEQGENGNGWMSVDVFYSATSDHAYGVLENYYTYQGFEQRMPSELLPIADVGSGSQICLAVSGRQKYSIFFWDRFVAPSSLDYDNVYFIANSFDEFINMLQPCEG